MSGGGPPNLKDQVTQCQGYLRLLKSTVLTLNEKVHENVPATTSVEEFQNIYDKLSRRIEEYYHKLEQLANQMPDRLPSVDALSRIAQDDQTSAGRDNLDAMVDSVNWNESYVQFMYFAEQFCRNGLRRKPYTFENRSLSTTNWNACNSPHNIFEQAFLTVQKEMAMKKLGIWTTILEKSAFGCVIEMKVGVVVDRQPVFQQKMMILENQGNIEMVIFVAPHEEWQYLDDYGEYGGRKLDLLQKSRYIVYQKLTAQANQNLQLLLQTMENPNKSHQLYTTLQVFSRYHKLFEVKCRFCHNVMKDFLPCVMFDPRQPNQSFHEACR